MLPARAHLLSFLLGLSGCAATQGRLINSSPTITHEPGTGTCAPIMIRRQALGSRWGEFLRVRIDTTATVIGDVRLDVPGHPALQRPFIGSGTDQLLEGRWTNERLDVPSALGAGSPLVIRLTGLTPAAGDCHALGFTIEQGAVIPDIDESAWLAALQRANTTPTSQARAAATAPSPPRSTTITARRPSAPPPRAAPKTASDEREWKTWVGHASDLDTSEWEPWPLASHFTPPTVGSALSRGVWLAWSALSEDRRRVAETLASPVEHARIEGPAQMATLVERLRAQNADDASTALLVLGGAELTARFHAVNADSLDTFLQLSREPKDRHLVESARTALMYRTAFALGWPVPDLTDVTSPFGMRTHPTLGGQRLHTGIDLSVPEGTPIIAAGAGVVLRAGETPVNGRFVIIDHGDGVTTAYLHNSRVLVTEGQVVAAGEFIAESGNTGRSTGPHLHYQLELNRQPVDPAFFRPRVHVLAGR